MSEHALHPSVEDLAMILGEWRGKEIVHPAAGAQGSADATVSMRAGLGGVVIFQDYEQKRDMGDVFRGHAVIRLDGEKGEYVMHWFDGAGSHTPFRGRLNGAVLELVSESPDFTGRCRYDFTREGEYAFTLEVAVAGGPWAPYVDGMYQRV